MSESKIEWTDATWNPVTGCSKVSDGCKHCYAERVFARMSQNPKVPAYHGRKFTDVMCHEERLNEPLKWRKPRMIFVNSMSDLFHEDVPDEFIEKILRVMGDAWWHTYQILTKRPDRMKQHMNRFAPWRPHNIWLGVSVENQETADERIPLLLETMAAVRFVSYEPALGPVEFCHEFVEDVGWIDSLRGACHIDGCNEPIRGERIHWVIAGGESGPNARPSHPDWFRSVRDQCQAAGVPFFFKQWGEWMPLSDWRKRPSEPEGPTIVYMPEDRITWVGAAPIELCNAEVLVSMCRVGKHCAGRLLDGVEWSQFPGGTT